MILLRLQMVLLRGLGIHGSASATVDRWFCIQDGILPQKKKLKQNHENANPLDSWFLREPQGNASFRWFCFAECCFD